MQRTDMAIESGALARDSVGLIDGVTSHRSEVNGVTITDVEILNERGAAAIGKPAGRYITLDLASAESDAQTSALCAALAEMLPAAGPLLVAGLGNRAVTPDALGPLALEHLLVTRHLTRELPTYFGTWRVVSALTPGVTGTTGLDAAEIIAGAVERVKPAAVVVIDALASRSAERLCASAQLASSGITPGSGVGNSRAALDERTLGVPVLAVGVPTVIDAASLCDECAAPSVAGMFVTPRDIDKRVADMAKLIGTSLSMAIHDLTATEVREFLS